MQEHTRPRCELADLVSEYIAHARQIYNGSRHWMNIRCALAHLTLHARDITWPELHQTAHGGGDARLRRRAGARGRARGDDLCERCGR